MKISLYTILLVFMFGCTNPQRKAELRLEMVEGQLNTFKAKKIRKCKEGILAIANRQVDTLLMDQALYSKIDTFLKPPKPIRPVIPAERYPVDTTHLGPIIR